MEAVTGERRESQGRIHKDALSGIYRNRTSQGLRERAQLPRYPVKQLDGEGE